MSKLQTFRSCYKDEDKYSVGDFVFVQKKNQSENEARVARIDVIYDKGSKFGESRLKAEVTWFLRKGDISSISQGERELVMNQSSTKENLQNTVSPRDFNFACQVMHKNELEKGDTSSFYYDKSYDGRRLTTLSQKEYSQKYQFHVKKKNTISRQDETSPKRERNKTIAPSTPAMMLKNQPLVDMTHTDNETTDSQEDDIDELFSDKMRSSIKRRNSQKTTSLKPGKDRDNRENVPNLKSPSKSPRKRTLIDDNILDLDSDDEEEKAIPIKSTRLSQGKTSQGKLPGDKLSQGKTSQGKMPEDKLSQGKTSQGKMPEDKLSQGKTSQADNDLNTHNKSHPTRSVVNDSPANIKPTTRTRRSIATSKPVEPVTQPAGRKRSRRSIAVIPTNKTSTSSSHNTTVKSAKKGAAVKNLIESVEYGEADTMPEKVKDPYDFSSDDQPSPRKKVTSFTAWKLSESAKKAELEKGSASPLRQSRRKLLGVMEDESEITPSSVATSRTSRRQTEEKNEAPVAQSEKPVAAETTNRSARKSTSKTTATQSARKEKVTKSRASKRLSTTSAPVSSNEMPDEPDSKVLKPAETTKMTKRRSTSRKMQQQDKIAQDISQRSKTTPKRESKYCLDSSILDSEGDDPQSSDDEPAVKTPAVQKHKPARSTPARSAKKTTTYKNEKQRYDSDEDDVFDADKIASSSDSAASDDDEVIINNKKKISRQSSTRQRKTVPRKSTATTPGRRKLSALTPSVPVRHKPLCKSESALEQARSQLHVSVVPDSLPCRGEEFANILSYVESKLQNKTGGCLYISGVPGTGKTATVYEVMRSLEQAHADGEIPKYRFVEINGMRLTQPHQAFVQIYKSLTQKKVTADHATSLLDTMFSKSKKQESIVLLVDELDLLMTRKQDVLYNLFDWPTKPDSKLIVLTIANTMDLPERVMMNRVSSRLGLNRMTFQPYTFQQLQEIVHSRLSGIGAFDPDAVQLASRKVAAVSGDARRALDICRRSTEVAEAKGDKQVNMMHVDSVLQEMFSSPKISAIRNLSLYERLTLKAIVAEFTRSGLEEATLYQVFRHIPALCAMDRMPSIKMSHLNLICTNLNNVKLVLLENNGCSGIYQRIRLNVSQDDVQYALREEKQG